MNEQSKPITEQDLNAFVDGQLDAVRHAELEAHIAQNPQAAQQVKDYQAYNAGLHALFDEVLTEDIPEQLSVKPTLRRSTWPYLQTAAMFAALAVGTVIGWVSHGSDEPLPGPTARMVNDAFASYVVYTPEVLHPVEVTREHEQHLVAWLSKRLKTDVRAPALSALGYELLGGRLLSSDSEPAAQFMYENSQGRRLTLFVRRRNNEETQTAFRYTTQDGVQGFYWIDGNLGYALIGDIDKDTLSNAAHVVYQALNK